MALAVALAALLLPLAVNAQPSSKAGDVRADTAHLPLIDVLTTRAGHWRLYDAGRDRTLARYVWTLEENPAFVRIMICKRAFTHEARDGDALDLSSVAAQVKHRGETQFWQLRVAQGACRIAQNMEPVAPRAAWLREAVEAGRLPAYRRERAFRPGARVQLPIGAIGTSAYDATSLGGDSSSNNYVGVTSAQGGEYSASRGFLHDIDARVVDAVLHGEDIGRAWGGVAAYSWYSLAHPQGAVWSAANHVTVDPQLPLPGDRGWEIANAGQRVRPDIDSVIPTAGWTRDLAHLENSGFVHWILTEDPAAGLLVQRQAAYALASFYEYRRQRGDGVYRAYDEQERGMYNLLSAAWKARDVAARVASNKGSVIWRLPRAAKMADDIIADLDRKRAEPLARPGGDPDTAVRRIVGLPLAGVRSGVWETTDGRELTLRGFSAFELPQYGKEPLYLWSRAGDARVRRWFAASARHLVVRTLHIGGALGVDRGEDKRGSTLPAAPVASLPFRDELGWARWVRALPVKQAPTDSFDGASLHTLTQIRGTLLLARAAGLRVPELDAALRKIDSDWARTSAPRYPDMEMAKHWAAPN